MVLDKKSFPTLLRYLNIIQNIPQEISSLVISVNKKDYTIVRSGPLHDPYGIDVITVFVGKVKAEASLFDRVSQKSHLFQNFVSYENVKYLSSKENNDLLISLMDSQYGLKSKYLVKESTIALSFSITQNISNCGAVFMYGLSVRDKSLPIGTLMEEVIDFVCLEYNASMISFTDWNRGEIVSSLGLMTKGKNPKGIKVSMNDVVENPNSGNDILSGSILHRNVDLDFQGSEEDDDDWDGDDDDY